MSQQDRLQRLAESAEDLAAFGGPDFLQSLLRASTVQTEGAPAYMVIRLPSHLREFLETRADALADYQRIVRDGDVAEDWSAERLLVGLVTKYYEECAG